MEILTALTRLNENLSALRSRPKPYVMYHLAENPPFARVQMPDGNDYKIYTDGRTFWLFGSMELPSPGCPHPEAIFPLTFGAFLWRNRRLIPLAVFGTVALVALNFLLSLTDAGYHRIMITGFAAAMNYTLFFFTMLCVIVAFMYNFGRGAKLSLDSPDEITALLEAGHPDISPDILVMSSGPDEKPDEYARRINSALTDQLPAGQYVLVFTFRTSHAIIVRNPDTKEQVLFSRAMLTKDIPAWMQEVSDPRIFERETWPEFVAYVRAFCVQFAAWSRGDKMRNGNPAKALINDLKATARTVTFALLTLFAFNASAQSAVPIPTNAGQSIFRSVPDSMELEKLKQDMLLSKYQVGREIAPRQMFVMWTFHNWIVPIMFLFGLLAWFWAKAAFRESEHDQGGNVIFGIGIANGGHYARRIVFILAAAIAVVEIADSVIWAFFREQNLWWAAIKCVCLAVLWMYGVNWITPNPRKVENTPTGQGFPMVGGGQKRIG